MQRRLDPLPAPSLVDWLAIASALFIIGRTALLNLPEIIPFGAQSGSVLFDLALAYLSAWIFNILVVALPRKREIHRMYVAVGSDIQGLSGVAETISNEIGHASGKPLTFPAEMTAYQVSGGNLSLTATGPNMIIGVPSVPATWLQYLIAQTDRAAFIRNRIAMLVPVMETDLLVLLQKEESARSRFLKTLSMLTSYSGVSTSVGTFGEDLAKHAKASQELRQYFEANVREHVENP